LHWTEIVGNLTSDQETLVTNRDAGNTKFRGNELLLIERSPEIE